MHFRQLHIELHRGALVRSTTPFKMQLSFDWMCCVTLLIDEGMFSVSIFRRRQRLSADERQRQIANAIRNGNMQIAREMKTTPDINSPSKCGSLTKHNAHWRRE